MKATLSFNLPEEREEFELASKAGYIHLVLWEVDQYLRSKLKYEDLPEEQDKIFQEVRDKLHEIANSYNVEV